MDPLTPSFSNLVGVACAGGLLVWVALAFVFFCIRLWERFAGRVRDNL